jgi:hypothetical protein
MITYPVQMYCQRSWKNTERLGEEEEKEEGERGGGGAREGLVVHFRQS